MVNGIVQDTRKIRLIKEIKFVIEFWFELVNLVLAYISPVISSSTSIITVSNSKNLTML